MNNKKGIIFVIAVVIVIAVLGIIALLTNVLNFEHIPDENGTDTNLTTMTIQDLETRNYRYGAKNYCIKSTLSRECSAFSVHSGTGASDVNRSSITHTADLMSGIMIAQEEYASEGEDITYTIESVLTSGNMQIIIIGPDLDQEAVVPVNESTIITLENCEKGDYLVIVGAESAEFTLDIDVDVE